MSQHIRVVQPEGWPRPKGYVNGMVSTGRTLHVAGQVGWETDERFAVHDLAGQFARALDNVLAVVHAAGGAAEHVVSMTVYVTSVDAYREATPALGPIWRERFGRHYPAMALVMVAGLLDPGAKVEIQGLAVLP